MAGGTWTRQNKVRPGAYINTVGKNVPTSGDTTRGVVLMPVLSSWGPVGVPIKVSGGTNLLEVFGKSSDDPTMFLIGEVLKQASELIAIRLSGGTVARTEEGGVLEAEALYQGTTGNNITLQVSTRELGGTTYMILNTYLGYDTGGSSVESLVFNQEVKLEKDGESENILPKAVDFSDNPYVKITSIESLPGELASIALMGGTDTPSGTLDITKFVNAMETQDYNIIAWPIEENATQIVNVVKRLRDDEGKKVQVVVANPVSPEESPTNTFDSEGCVMIPNGVVLADGTEVSPYQATAFIAGASANAGHTASLTYANYMGAVEATPKYNNEKTIELLEMGFLLFTDKRGAAVVEQDINSLITLGPNKSKDFKKNRVMRTLDLIANNSKESFEDNFIGKVNNNQDGRELFKSDRISFFDSLQGEGAIENFTAEDISISMGSSKDNVVMDAGITPVDSMEKLYMTVDVY